MKSTMDRCTFSSNISCIKGSFQLFFLFSNLSYFTSVTLTLALSLSAQFEPVFFFVFFALFLRPATSGAH